MSPEIHPFDKLPDSAYVRESQLIQRRKHSSSLSPLPFSAPTLWRMVKNGTFPKPVKLSMRVTAWNVGDVRRWMALRSQGGRNV
jgi:prophage regulatory protein